MRPCSHWVLRWDYQWCWSCSRCLSDWVLRCISSILVYTYDIEAEARGIAVATGIKSTRNEAAGEWSVEERQREKDGGSGIVRILCHVDKSIYSVARDKRWRWVCDVEGRKEGERKEDFDIPRSNTGEHWTSQVYSSIFTDASPKQP